MYALKKRSLIKLQMSFLCLLNYIFERFSELVENLSDVSKSKIFVNFIKVTTATINKLFLFLQPRMRLYLNKNSFQKDQEVLLKRPPKPNIKIAWLEILIGNL